MSSQTPILIRQQISGDEVSKSRVPKLQALQESCRRFFHPWTSEPGLERASERDPPSEVRSFRERDHQPGRQKEDHGCNPGREKADRRSLRKRDGEKKPKTFMMNCPVQSNKN